MQKLSARHPKQIVFFSYDFENKAELNFVPMTYLPYRDYNLISQRIHNISQSAEENLAVLTGPKVHRDLPLGFCHSDPQGLGSIPPKRQKAAWVHTNVKRQICHWIPHVVSSYLMDFTVATWKRKKLLYTGPLLYGILKKHKVQREIIVGFHLQYNLGLSVSYYQLQGIPLDSIN